MMKLKSDFVIPIKRPAPLNFMSSFEGKIEEVISNWLNDQVIFINYANDRETARYVGGQIFTRWRSKLLRLVEAVFE